MPYRRANTICLTLLEATLTLYPANAAGEPILTQPLWHGVDGNDLAVRDRWIKTETRPTGSKFPHRHPLVPQFEISIGRVWALPLEQLDGFMPGRGKYVLDITWREDLTRDWHREVFYGVTISERGRAAKDRDGEFVEEQVWDAEYFVASSGRGTVPEIPAGLRYLVRYVTDSENVDLYTYDPGTDLFTEAVAGVTTNRAALTYSSGHAGDFAINFAGDDITALRVTGGEIEVFELRVGSPTLADLPRVEFWYGANRVGAVTRAGALHATRFLALNPLEGDKFQMFSSSALSFTLDATAATGNFVTFKPTSLAGLKLWARVESLGNEDGPVGLWPDESGQGNDLGLAGILTDEDEDALTDEEADSLTAELAEDDAPALRMSPALDEWSLHSIPVTGGALRFKPTAALNTKDDVFNPDTHTIFIVACPFGPGDGVSVDRKLLTTAPDGNNKVEFVLSDDARAEARFAADFLGTPTLNTAVGLALGSATQLTGWHLFEQEGAARWLTPAIVNLDLIAGTLPAAIYSYVIVDVLPAGQYSPSLASAFDLTGGGGLFQLRVNLPAATAGATERRIYRTKVSGGTDYFLRATVAPGAASYDDNLSMTAFAATSPAALTAPARAGFLKLRVDGVEQAAVADLVGLASGETKSIQIGAESGGWWGYVKAVLVYEGNLSDTAKARVRRFLNNAYRIY
jgi:hypothetical protein